MDAFIIVLWIQYFPLKKISAIIKLFTSVDGEQNENNPHNRTKWESSKISEKNVGKLITSHKFFSSDFNRILRVKRDDKGKSMSPYHLASFSISFLSSCFCFCVDTGNIYCTIELFISCFSFTMLHFFHISLCLVVHFAQLSACLLEVSHFLLCACSFFSPFSFLIYFCFQVGIKFSDEGYDK